MNIYRFRNICNSQKFLFKFRRAHTASKTDSAIEVLTKQEAKVGQSHVGITVASVENYSPISQVAVVVKAGSRYENHENLGITHYLRNYVALSTRDATAFSLTRNLEMKGAKLNVTGTREHLIYTLECSRDEIDPCLEILAEVTTNQAFKPWEINDSIYRIKLDLALLDSNPEALLMETLHKAAFRGGLANSLFCPTFMVGKYSTDNLLGYVRENFASSKTSIVGLGIDHEHLESSVSKLFDLSNPAGPDGASKFASTEIRTEKDIPFVHTAIVAEGSGMMNVKEALSLGVLQCLLGAGTNSKLGNASLSKLGSAAAKSTDSPFTVSSVNINYSDTGLFGVYIAGVPDDMKQIVKAVVSQMREVTKSFTEADVQNAKHHLKAKIRFGKEKSKDLLSDMCIDTSYFGRIRDTAEIEKAIDELKTSDIAMVAAKVMKAKPAMASIGRLHSTPYLDELL